MARSFYTITLQLAGCALLLVTLAIRAVASPVPAEREPWQEPCNGATGASPTNSTELANRILTLKTNAMDIEAAAKARKDFLTTGTNPSVPATVVQKLNQTHVINFTYHFQNSSNDNITEVLKASYVYLSEVYIFTEQSKNNTACDENDRSTAESKAQNILNKVLVALCNVDTSLRLTDHQMPAQQIPDKDAVLGNSDPDLRGLQPCGSDLTRNTADYIISRDTEELGKELQERYDILHQSLTASQINSTN